MSRVTGVDKIRRNMDHAWVKAHRATAAALYEEGLAILAVSVKQVPVDTGRLRSSAYCAPPASERGMRVRVELGYGTTYAVPVHERTDAHHPVGKAKYLEDPINAARSGFATRVAGRARFYFEQGQGVDAVQANLPTAPQG